MSKFVIRGDKDQERPTELWLEGSGDEERVYLKAARGQGSSGYHVIGVHSDGTISRTANIPDGLGFQLDVKNRVVIWED